jgi:hypothetical protein
VPYPSNHSFWIYLAPPLLFNTFLSCWIIYALCCYLIYQSFNRPLDLCDTITSSPDILPVGYPGSHTNVLTLPNHHGSLGPTLPTSNMNARLPGSPGMVLGSSLPSPSTLNAPSR